MFDGASQDFEFGSFRLRTGDGVLLKNGEVVALTPKAFQILILLVRQHGKLITKDEIMREVWAETFVEESSIIRNISVLRKILLDDASNCYIETFHRRGYRFVAPMREIAAEMPTEIAVLPFAMLNSDAEYEHLGIGLADTLTTHLSRFREIIVRPTSAVINYAAAPDIFAVGKQLNVQAVLSGSIQFSRESLRVNLQFVSIESRRLIWGANIDGQLSDILKVQDEISRQVVKLLLPQTSENQSKPSVPTQTADSEAYQLYLRGRFYWNKRTDSGIEKAILFFRQAIALDSRYALAYAGLADCFLVQVETDHANRQTLYDQAREAAQNALAIDETLGEAVASLAHVLFFGDWNAREAEILYQKAVEMNPNYATTRHWYGVFLTAHGRYDEAEKQIRTGLALDPLSLTLNRAVGAVLYYSGRFAEAVAQLEETLDIEPNFVPALYGLALLRNHLGETGEALRLMLAAERLAPESSLVKCGLGQIYANAGNRAKAQEYLESLPPIFVPFKRAMIYNFLGETVEMFEWLEKAVSERDVSVLFLNAYPDFRKYHQDPRFIAFSQKIGLEK